MIRSLGFALVAVVAAACTDSATGPSLDPPGVTQATPALAFEPVTGIPEERTAVLAEALVSGAVSRGIVVVPREADDAVFRAKGYFSAARAGSATELTYAWDIFDRQEARVHRITGTERVQATVPNPWQAVTDDALRRVASRTVEELQDWLSRYGSPNGRVSQAANPPPGEGVTALLGDGGLPAATPAPGDGRVYVGPVDGMDREGSAAFSRAMATRLAAVGVAQATNPAESDYVVTGEATVGPAHQDAQTVAIIWSVARPGGEGLGTVRQVRRVAAGTLESRREVSAQDAASAAAPGIVSLLRGL